MIGNRVKGFVASILLVIGLPALAQSTPECSWNAQLASDLRDPFTTEAMYSRSDFFGLDCGPLSVQFDVNRDMQDGEDFLAIGYQLHAADWKIVPQLRVSFNAPVDAPVRELALFAHRDNLNLMVRESLNNETSKFGGWYTDIPAGKVAVDLLGSATEDENGRHGFEVAAGVHSQELGFWAGYTDLDQDLVFAYAANNGVAGLYGYSLLDTVNDEGIAMVRFGFQNDGGLAGCYDLSWGVPTIRALLDVPPFNGNDLGMFQGGDWVIELGWVRSSENDFSQALAGRRWAQWRGGKFSAGSGLRHDRIKNNWEAVYEVRIDQAFADKEFFLMVRGPEATATAGITVAF